MLERSGVLVVVLAALGCGGGPTESPSCEVWGAPAGEVARCGSPAPGSQCCDHPWCDPARIPEIGCGATGCCVCESGAPRPIWSELFYECNLQGDGGTQDAGSADSTQDASPDDASADAGMD
jgi:hypothetical protein